MIKRNIVYSTDRGKMCPRCQNQINNCACSDLEENHKRFEPISVEKQTAGRRGKQVNIIRNIPLGKADLKKLTKELKKDLGVGGSFNDGEIVIQGSNKERIIKVLEEKGFSTK